ncbi:HsdM family class I SAM-dependent methyltransferase [Sphaerimonospora sp. CA-214678]|uniref:HsdM family class I SAM-dependent methyltransferase n=1 Tax=Sphaerimonospora sp. CA-214678 TaxID=3240029 RepID=UPI003D8AF08E
MSHEIPAAHEATVNAGEIARLADVGRAAVSNWRRRYEDFPQPVGGTASSPLFSLPEIEAWLRRNGKSFELSIGDRVWQRLRASAGDLRLGEMVGHAGAFLLYLRRDPAGWERLAHDPGLVVRLGPAVAAVTGDLPARLPGPGLTDPKLIRLIAEMAGRQGDAAAFEFLCERYTEAHSRRLAVTRSDLAAVMTRLACAAAKSILDPACGMGTLLLGVPRPVRLLGQEVNETVAVLTAVRLLLHGHSASIVAGDTLRADGFVEVRADAVVCDPPFNERAWGHEELVGDPRWGYGMPPRGESELAWVQHCLAHVRPGGPVAILMPVAAAGRRSGRRIRSNLLRGGALRAVITLSAGGPDLWLLRRPVPGEPRPATFLVADASDDLSVVESAWRACLARTEPAASSESSGPSKPSGSSGSSESSGSPLGCRAVRIVDVLDDEVDVGPARHLSAPGDAREFPLVRDRFRKAVAALADAVPDLAVLAEVSTDGAGGARADGGWHGSATTIAELAKAGMVTVRHSSLKALPEAHGPVRVLTVDDLAVGGPPSGSMPSGGGLVTIQPGDVVASAITARVAEAEGAVLGPHLSVFRVDPGKIDPEFLAGLLRFAAGGGTGRAGTSRAGASRVDVRRARVPRLPMARQRAYGRAFRRLLALEDGLREANAAGETLARAGVEGLISGTLLPPA